MLLVHIVYASLALAAEYEPRATGNGEVARPLPSIDASTDAYRTWTVYHGGPESIHYSSLTQINTSNVDQLRQAWTYETGDAFGGEWKVSSEFECNPIVIDKTLYAVTPKLRVIALDAKNGRLIWSFNPLEGVTSTQLKRRMRGVTYWSEGGDQRIFAVANQYLYALDARTGAVIRSFGTNGRVDLRESLGRDPEQIWMSATSPGIVYKDLLILGGTGSAPGDIRAFDVRTGKVRWVFHTIPHPGEFGYDTWPAQAWKHSHGANSWAGMSLDKRRGMVFVPTASAGKNARDTYGADRIGDNLFANALLALDANTGRRVWHFQTVRHDLWDRDLPAPPSLVTIHRNGRNIDAVAQITKSGYVYVFNRDTGESLFPIVERSFPASPLPGERTSATQPIPLLPAPFARQEFRRDMITRRTPAAQAAALAEFDKLVSAGQFIPPSLEATILFPGLDGGGEWGGAAFDPQTGLLYVNSSEAPYILRMQKRKPPATGPISGKSLYVEHCAGCHADDKSGSPPAVPSLIDLRVRLSKPESVRAVIEGTGRMPSFMPLGLETINAITDYVLYDIDHSSPGEPGSGPGIEASEYHPAELRRFLDADYYPAIQPPWGTLSAIDLNTGEYAWRIPFGEYPELAAKGIKNTGSDNYGGAVVTAGGLLFIGATVYDRKLRAYDKRTGALLWETLLPAAGTATPALYEVDGREYLVIAAGGGKDFRSKPGGSLVAFALPEKK